MGATCGAGTVYASGAPEFTRVFSRIHDARSLAYWSLFCLSSLSMHLQTCIILTRPYVMSVLKYTTKYKM